MLGPKVFTLASVLATQAVLGAPHVARQASLDDWLDAQEPIALKGILANIGPDGSKAEGVSAGLVIASPSKSEPDYFFTWTRDAALTMKAIADRFIVTKDSNLESILKAYVESQEKLQHVDNPSGGIDSGGLGEPKFNVDLTPFTGEWGRPQRDGPALRATALIAYANYLLKNNDTATVKNTIWPIVSRDLKYVANTWNQTGFDLWEEVEGTSFFTLIAQHRSLIEGVAIAKTLGVECTNCAAEAPKIRCLLHDMWNADGGHALADVNNDNGGRSNKGTQTFISSMHGFDLNAGCSDATFQPCSPRALSNLKVVADSFAEWGINSGVAKGEAMALGRYVEDVYMGGNPWYLTTSAAAEQLYYALAGFEKEGAIEITDVSLAFWKDISDSAATGKHEKGSDAYQTLTEGVRKLADGYLSVVQKYTPESGAMAEQYAKSDGTPLSAVDLTWSYAALLTAKAARDGDFPLPWGGDGAAGLEC